MFDLKMNHMFHQVNSVSFSIQSTFNYYAMKALFEHNKADQYQRYIRLLKGETSSKGKKELKKYLQK